MPGNSFRALKARKKITGSNKKIWEIDEELRLLLKIQE